MPKTQRLGLTLEKLKRHGEFAKICKDLSKFKSHALVAIPQRVRNVLFGGASDLVHWVQSCGAMVRCKGAMVRCNGAMVRCNGATARFNGTYLQSGTP